MPTKTGTTTRRRTTRTTPTQKVDKVNQKVATQKVVYNRVLKYKYPRNCTDPLERKAFRRKVRDSITKMKADIAGLRGEKRTKAKSKLEAYEGKMLMA